MGLLELLELELLELELELELVELLELELELELGLELELEVLLFTREPQSATMRTSSSGTLFGSACNCLSSSA